GESPAVDALAGRPVRWHRLTHEAAAAGDADAIATYVVDDPLPEDLGGRTHFFWTSGTQCVSALRRWPEIRDRWHGAGPRRPGRVLRDTLGPTARARVWLEYDEWLKGVLA